MSRKNPPTKETFDKLLGWLDPDREQAGVKYQKIQARLIGIFSCKGCFEAEDLADETINVVASKIEGLLERYEGDRALYFYAVAKKIYLEKIKPKPTRFIPPTELDYSERERMGSCLDKCLEQLSSADRKLVIRYHEDDKGARIQNRKMIAEELNISINALRIKVCHIHSRLKRCIEKHLEEQLPIK